MFNQVLSIPLLPVLYLQGKQLKNRIPEMPEAVGKRIGVTGVGKPLRVLVLGDSAAAGVGVKNIEQSLLGFLIEHLQDDYQLHWQLHAKSGAKTQQTLNSLNALKGKQFDVIITSLGVNDMTHGVKRKRWLASMSNLIDQLTEQCKPTLIITSSLPPIGKFPAIPFPLNWYLGGQASYFNQGLETQFTHHQHIQYLSLALDSQQHNKMPQDYLASDGFHPGKKVYQLWAAEAVRLIRKSYAKENVHSK